MFGLSQQEKYEKLLTKRRSWFKSIGCLNCPILDKDIYFTSKGFKHLLRDGTGRSRSIKDRMYRLGLLPLVIPVIQTATSVYDYRKDTTKKGKKYEIWELKEFVGKNTDNRPLVSVVLRRNGTGKIFFYSVRKKRQNNN